MKEPFFSIIMPAYNAEKFLSEAIESVLLQSFTDFELFVINDGSIDKTDDICRFFSKKDSRIVFIDKNNEGVSVARNVALDKASGEYVFFVDSDDIIYKDSLQKIHCFLKRTPVDYLRFEYEIIDSLGRKLYPNYEATKRRRYEGEKMESSECIKKLIRGEFFSWSGVFKRTIIEKNNLRFLLGCTYNEDTLFMMHFFMYSQTHVYVCDKVYGYRKSETAVTCRFTERNYLDVERVVTELQKIYYSQCKIESKVIKRIIEGLCLRLFVERRNKQLVENKIFDFCLKNPVTIEWQILSLTGTEFGIKILPVLAIFKKIIRKI